MFGRNAVQVACVLTSAAIAGQMPETPKPGSALPSPLIEARGLILAEKLSEAEERVSDFLKAHPESADGHYLLGYVLFRQQKAALSLAEYTRGAKYRRPGAAELEVVASDYVLLKDYTDADKWFTQSLALDAANFRVLYYLGRTKYNENRFEEAVAIFGRCLEIDPKNVKAKDNLGLTYEALGRTDEAVAAYQAAIEWEAESSRRDSGPYIDLGTLLVDTDRAKDAVPLLRHALEISPNELRAHRALGKAYLRLDDLAKAQAELERCVDLDPQSAPAHFMLSQVYRKRGMNEEARRETQKYAALAGEHSTETGPK